MYNIFQLNPNKVRGSQKVWISLQEVIIYMCNNSNIHYNLILQRYLNSASIFYFKIHAQMRKKSKKYFSCFFLVINYLETALPVFFKINIEVLIAIFRYCVF